MKQCTYENICRSILEAIYVYLHLICVYTKQRTCINIEDMFRWSNVRVFTSKICSLDESKQKTEQILAKEQVYYIWYDMHVVVFFLSKTLKGSA